MKNSLGYLAALLAAFLLASPASAQTYPAKPIRFVVPFTPGGSNDVLARVIGQKLAERWGQPVVVDNRPGAGGNIGADNAAKSPGDGYTWLMAANNILTINPHLGRTPFDPVKDFTPVAVVARVPMIMVTNASVPAASVKEFVAWAKARPGGVNYGSSGNGSPQHLAAELFKSMAGVDMVHVPYKGAAPTVADLVNGQLQVSFNATNVMLPQVKAGKLKALAGIGPNRYAALPDLPTVAESGVPGYAVDIWLGVVMPAGVPKDIVAKVNADILQVMQMPDVKEKLAGQGLELTASTPQEMGDLIRNDLVRWGKVIKEAGIKGD